MKISLILFALLLLGACHLGDKKESTRSWEVYYADENLQKDVKQLLAYLTNYDNSEDTKKSARLTKTNGRYTLQLVCKTEDEYNFYLLSLIAREVSDNVFSKAPLDLRLTDDKWMTLKAWKFEELDKIKTRGNLELFHDSSLSDADMIRLLDDLEQNGFVDEDERNIRLDVGPAKEKMLYLIVDEETAASDEFVAIYEDFRQHLERDVFTGEKVSIILSDPYFKELRTIKA